MTQGKSPTQYLGVRARKPPNVIVAQRAPNSGDKSYIIGDLWVDELAGAAYQNYGGALWIALGTGITGAVNTLTGTIGGAIAPVAGNIDILGTAAQGLSFAGTAGTLTGTIADWTTAQKGVGVLSTNAQAVTGTGTTQAVTPAALTARIQSPGAIGGATPGSGSFTTLTTTTTIVAGTTITSTLGNIIATNGNFVGSTAGTGFQFAANTATGAAASPIVINSRAGQAIFTTVSIAAAADLTLTITNSAITASTTQVIYSMSGATTGSALSIKSVTNSAGSSAVVITNGTGATTSTSNITLNFLVVN